MLKIKSTLNQADCKRPTQPPRQAAELLLSAQRQEFVDAVIWAGR